MSIREPPMGQICGALVLICLIGCSPPAAWAIHERRGDIEAPPFEPSAASYQHLMRAKRSMDESANALGAEVGDHSQVAAGYLLADSTDRRLMNMDDALDRNLSALLDRVGPDMRPSRDYHDFKDITLDVSKRAWTLMREHAKKAITDRINLAWPTIERLLSDAKTSAQCVEAIKSTFAGAKRMESWAVKLLNSWGSFPMSGLFEGSYSDVGAFFTCVNINENKYIDHAHYCSITLRPVMASPKDYELIVRKEPLELLMYFEENKQRASINQTASGKNRTMEEKSSRDAMTELLDHAQYHHYVYYKWGTCWPIACNPYDVRRVSQLVGRTNILMNGPVKCYSRSSNDYEQEFDEDVDDHLVASSRLNQTGKPVASNHASSTNATIGLRRKKKLVISTWDENNGIFIWKPHFNRAHKISAAVLISLTAFIFIMTLIDFCVNKLPLLGQQLSRALAGLPLTNSTHQQQQQQRQQPSNGKSLSFGMTSVVGGDASASSKFTVCVPTSATLKPARKHPHLAGFQMIPTDATSSTGTVKSDADDELPAGLHEVQQLGPPSFFMSVVADCSFLNNFCQFFHVSENQLKKDILCLHGIRCITMVWIILAHTMAYNDWSAFARIREVEVSLNSLMSQPLLNGSYLVDTFFLMSGLLSALTAYKHNRGLMKRFNSFAFILGRWARLTPQIFVMSLVYILLPTWSYGPHWYPYVGEYSENCAKNWWINVLHLQAFYKKDEMCNFVTWWISIDYFYHFLAVGAIWITLRAGHKWGFYSMAAFVLSQIVWQSKRHYELALPPNVLSTIPQTGIMWTTMTLDFYWTPYAHSVPFFFGFYLGYLMALKPKLIKRQLNSRRALIGWMLAASLLIGQQYGTYWWVTGKAGYSKLVSTLFFGACSIIWNGSICWIIIACQYGYGGIVQRILSWKAFIVLGKASYLIYLSHFQVMFMYFGNHSILLEPTPILMGYSILGNIVVSTIWGIILCTVYEIPWLKTHRRLMKYF